MRSPPKTVSQPVDGVVLDLGVSSFQFDAPERGFSFRGEGPLDMRMSRSGESAADLVNTAAESTLRDIIARYGEERNARRIARAIIAARPISTTAELAKIVSEAQGPAALKHAIHPATRTFQALRITVNDELGELSTVWMRRFMFWRRAAGLRWCRSTALRTVSSNSSSAGTAPIAPAPRAMPPDAGSAEQSQFRLLTNRPQTPSADEIANNPRARSAKLRIAERLAA